MDSKNIGKRTKRQAVSPVVATLILIIVAIVGAVAVGLIVSGIGTQTSKQANGGQANGATQTVLYVGGSTTVYPVTSAAIPAFEGSNPGITVSIAQGGSDAGMQGVLSGAYDIGEASSANAVNNLYTAVQNNNINGFTVTSTLIGGSGVVFGTTSTCGAIAAGVCAGGAAIGATPLYDGAKNICLEFTRAVLATMYADGVFYIATGACAPAATATNGASALNDTASISTTAVAGYSGPFAAVSRSDPGGTEDTACGYLSVSPSALSYTGGSGQCGQSKNIGSGNLGVLQQTQSCAGTGVAGIQGCVGFFDLGFAEGASAQAASTCSSAAASAPCKIFIAEVSSGATGTLLDPLLQASYSAAASVSSFAYTNDSTANIHAFIKSALKTEATINVQTMQLSQTVASQKFFPDQNAPTTNPLDRTFYLVTNGAPTTNEQKFILFMSSYNAEPYFTAAGYFSQYDFTSA